MSNQPANSNSQKLTAAIKKVWDKLSDQEIALYNSEATRSKFFDAVKTKYSINPEEAAKTVKKLEADSTASDSSSAAPKVANA